MMNRRAFLRTTGAAAVAGLAGGIAGCGLGRGIPASAGGAGALPPLGRVGLQLSTVRELMQRDLADTFRRVAEIGYRHVETPRDLYDRPAAEVRGLLDRYGLRTTSGLYPFEMFQNEMDRVLETARVLGQEYIGLPSMPEALHSSRDGYRQAADRFNEWGARARAAGLTLTYHNHAFEFQTLGGDSPAFDLLLERTDPALVAFELDLYWITKGGHDPVAYIQRYPGRFHLFHLKDITAGPERDFAPVGAGVIDFRRILSLASVAGMRYAYVEHDRPQDPLASVRTSYATLAGMLPRS